MGRSEGRAFLVEGTASHKHSMFQAGQDGSQCSGADRGRGIVGGDETGPALARARLHRALQDTGRTLATSLCATQI